MSGTARVSAESSERGKKKGGKKGIRRRKNEAESAGVAGAHLGRVGDVLEREDAQCRPEGVRDAAGWQTQNKGSERAGRGVERRGGTTRGRS